MEIEQGQHLLRLARMVESIPLEEFDINRCDKCVFGHALRCGLVKWSQIFNTQARITFGLTDDECRYLFGCRWEDNTPLLAAGRIRDLVYTKKAELKPANKGELVGAGR